MTLIDKLHLYVTLLIISSLIYTLIPTVVEQLLAGLLCRTIHGQYTMPSEAFIRQEYIQEGGLRAVLRRIDAEYLIDLEDEVKTWYESVLETTKCKNIGEVSEEIFNKSSIKKAQLAELLGDVLSTIEKQHEMVRDLRAAHDLLKTELLELQSAMFKIQNEQLKCNQEQFQSLQTTVKSTVQDTMQSEMKSYSSALTEKSPLAIISPETLKKVVQAVVEEEDRSKNLMLFGLEEEKNETLSNKIGEVFVSIGEKPSFVASRVGKKSTSKARPVKVTLTGNGSVNHILTKARRLRTVESYKSVFLSPDRSPDERNQHIQLVLDLKQKVIQQPGKKHFIRQGQIVTTEKS